MAKITMVDGTVFEGTPAELVGVARAFEESKHVVESVTHTFKDGDRVLTLKNGEFDDILADYYGTVEEDSNEHIDEDDPYSICVRGDNGDYDYFRPQDLELVTEPAQLKEGDKVRIIGTSIFCADHVGEIGTFDGIDSDGDHSVIFEHLPQRLYKRENIKLVTEEETEADAIERKRNAIFTENGRKVNELRKGDLIRVIDNCGAYAFGNGSIVEVSRDSITLSANVGNGWLVVADIVAFVENRLDLN